MIHQTRLQINGLDKSSHYTRNLMRYLLGIDLGTSSLRAMLVNEKGRVIAVAGMEYPIIMPKKDWAEQNPEHWWKAAKYSIHKILEQSKIKSSEINGIGFSGQMHGMVLVDFKGRSLRNAIPWVDKRSTKECEFIKEKIGEARIYKITGIPVFPGFLLPSLLWVRKNEPQIYRKVYKVLSPKDFLRVRFTGEIFTEPTDGCATLMMDVTKRKWSQEVLTTFKVPESIMAEIIESFDIAGRVNRETAKETGLREGTPVITGGGDQAMGAIGSGLIKPGIANSTIGTGGQFITIVEKPIIDPKRRIHTFCHAFPEKWILMGAILSAGLSLRWFRDNFIQMNTGGAYEKLSREASKVPAGSEGLIFLPYLIGERTPHMDPDAKGCLFGLTLRHNRTSIARAIMEGVTYAMRESLDIFEGFGIKIEKIIASGGGGKSAVWRQIQADVYDREIFTVNQNEHSVYGAALLAGVGTGIFKNIEDACKNIKYKIANCPSRRNIRTYDKIYKVYRGLYPALKPIFI